MRWWRGWRGGQDERSAPEPALTPANAAHDLSALVCRRADDWAPRFKVRGIALELLLEEGDLEWAPDELAVVVDALLSNAMRFSDRGDRVCVQLRSTDHRVELQVADIGIGITSEDLPQVFERFFRGSLGRDRMLGGLGVGLSVARDITERHGGMISCDSVEGEGTAVRVVLPKTRPETRALDLQFVGDGAPATC